MKKSLLCILLALISCLSLGAPALAMENDDWHVYDLAEVIDDADEEELEALFRQIGDTYDTGLVVVTVTDFHDYTDGDDFLECAQGIYEANDFGLGDDHDGALLFISTADSGDYTVYYTGETAETAFGEADFYLDDRLFDFYLEDDWSGMAFEFRTACDELLERASRGDPYRFEEDPPIDDDDPLWYFYDLEGVMTLDENLEVEDLFTRVSETYGVGVYGAVVPDSSEYGDSPEEAAENIFLSMGFGLGEDYDGIFLLADSGRGESALCVSGPKAEAAFSPEVRARLLENFSAQLPLYQDAMLYFGSDCETVLKGETLPGMAGDTRTTGGAEETPAPTAAPAESTAPATPAATAPAAPEQTEWYLYDTAGLLTQPQADALESRLRGISEKYNCGVYIATVEDFRDFGASVEDASERIYYGNDFGLGPNKDGLFLLLSMDDRDYDFFRKGWGDEVVSGKGSERVEEAFKSYFRSDDWNGGLNAFADECEFLMAQADAGEVYGSRMPTGTKLAIAIIPALLIAFIACSVMKAKMKSVRMAADADAYTAPGSLDLTDATDLYTHTTETRRKIESSSRSGGGGGSSHSSGKF